MDYNQFVDVIVEMVRTRLGEEYIVDRRATMKNNGVELTGVTVQKKESHIVSCAYLENLYALYQDTACEEEFDFEEAVNLVIDTLQEREYCSGDVIEQIMDWHWVKEHIYCRLLNTEMNEEVLKSMPNRQYLDLSITYYLLLEGERVGTTYVSYQMMDCWKQTEESLYQTALRNLENNANVYFKDIVSFLPNIKEQMNSVGQYVLYQLNVPYGSSQILNKNTLEMVHRKVGGGYYMLPSSVHEWIIVPLDKDIQPEILKKILNNLNECGVEPEEVLSSHIYKYENGAVEIVA